MSEVDNSIKKTEKAVFVIVIVAAFFSISYAILRYNIFGQVPWKDLPFYVLNKSISLTAIILFTISNSLKFLNKTRVQIAQKWIDSSTTIGAASLLLIIIHVFISLMLFKPEIFTKFFEENGTVNLLGGISMITGIISFVLILGIKLNSLSNFKNNHKTYSSPLAWNIVMLIIITHLFFMGYGGWITPEKWHGGMPPISLIAFLFCLSGLLLKVFFRSGSILKNQLNNSPEN